jgi:hypothetical protein
VVGWSNPYSRIESPVSLPAVVAILCERVLEKLITKADIVAKSADTVRQCGKYGMLVGWVVLRTKVEVSMFRFMVCIMAQRAMSRKVTVSLHLHG